MFAFVLIAKTADNSRSTQDKLALLLFAFFSCLYKQLLTVAIGSVVVS
jgi:hypothetical protein